MLLRFMVAHGNRHEYNQADRVDLTKKSLDRILNCHFALAYFQQFILTSSQHYQTEEELSLQKQRA